MKVSKKYIKVLSASAAAVFILIVLYIIQENNYLLFHNLTEIFSIIIAFSIFIIGWNGRKYSSENYMLLIGISFLFTGFLDLLHTLSYPGMSIFTDYDYYTNQLWIAARGLQALSLLTAFILKGRTAEIRVPVIFTVYILITGFLIYSIFFSDIFPVCFVAYEGQTLFKILAEYTITAVLSATAIIIYRKRETLSKGTFLPLILSFLFAVVAELSFTFYVSNYGLSNMVGHYAKILSFYLLYRVIVVKSLQAPFETIFSELHQKQKELEESNNLKTTIFSIISHDLISPFSAISSFVHVMSEDRKLIPEEEMGTYLGELKDNVDRTGLLLTNLLNWSRLEMGGHQQRFSEQKIRDLIIETANPLLPKFNQKNIALKVKIQEESTLLLDRDTFQVVIRNILSNAVKFSYRDSEIIVRESKANGVYSISFIDFGTGFNKTADPENIKIGQSLRGTEDEKGSGIGLLLIKRYTEENGGHMTVESTPGKGTIVSLHFKNPEIS